MASEIKLPELGENLTGGDVLDVKVAPGDKVTKGQTLIEVEAEKATVEVPSPVAGRIAKMLVKKGDRIDVGQAVCLIDGADGQKPEAPKTAPVREAPGTETKPKPVAADGGGESPDEPASVEKKAVQEAVPARAEKPQPVTGDDRQDQQVRPKPPAEPDTKGTSAQPVLAGPATRRLARELGVDLYQVAGGARAGRVTEEDVKAYVRQLASGGAIPRSGLQAPPLPDFERWGPVEHRPLDAVRRKTAEQVSLAWALVPHVTQHDEADITELDAFRRQREGKGPKLTVTAFALKAAAIALKQFPQVNASLDASAGQLILKRYYHIGVAVDTERGLLVPVIRDVDKKSVEELSLELADVAERARQKKLQPDEMRGGTFTITNLGGIGGTAFTPIVNYPEVAILGLSRARQQPVVRDGQVIARLVLPLSLSYDHRAIDGADGARFTRAIASMLESPLLMLLHA